MTLCSPYIVHIWRVLTMTHLVLGANGRLSQTRFNATRPRDNGRGALRLAQSAQALIELLPRAPQPGRSLCRDLEVSKNQGTTM